MIILLHTSKTMRPAADNAEPLQKPVLLNKARTLADYVKTLSPIALANSMHISPKLAKTTHGLIASWTDAPDKQRVAIDSFLGDIYSGLQVADWSAEDRMYANETLRILSGLYGVLRPLDGIYPYRLEMGYKFPEKRFFTLYNYWGSSIAESLAPDSLIINLSAVEYSKVITTRVDESRIITPTFLTINSKTNNPTFVVVHAKIARGAFARWLIKNKITDTQQLKDFHDLGYKYDKRLSTAEVPVFVCREFKGIGLSVRLT